MAFPGCRGVAEIQSDEIERVARLALSSRPMLEKLAAKGYSGPVSVELFLPKFRDGDPFAVATEIRQKCEAVMRKARVL
jgi:hypothetical protein